MTAKLLREMHGHTGVCELCEGPVKMKRNHLTLQLEPEHCWCLQCGQIYQMHIDNIVEWEAEQWKQKSENDTEN